MMSRVFLLVMYGPGPDETSPSTPRLLSQDKCKQEAYNKLERVSSSVHVVEFGPPKKENKPDFYEAKNQS